MEISEVTTRKICWVQWCVNTAHVIMFIIFDGNGRPTYGREFNSETEGMGLDTPAFVLTTLQDTAKLSSLTLVRDAAQLALDIFDIIQVLHCSLD